MTREEVLQDWQKIYDLFKNERIEPSFFTNDLRDFEKIDNNDEYYSLYYEFDITKNYTDMECLGRTLGMFKLIKYEKNISKVDYFDNQYWRLKIRLTRKKDTL